MSYQYMSNRLVEVIQELRDYLGPEAQGLSDEDVVHKVMCQALDYRRQLSELKLNMHRAEGHCRILDRCSATDL